MSSYNDFELIIISFYGELFVVKSWESEKKGARKTCVQLKKTCYRYPKAAESRFNVKNEGYF